MKLTSNPFPLVISKPTFSKARSDFENILVSTKFLKSAIFTRFFLSRTLGVVVIIELSSLSRNGDSKFYTYRIEY